MCPDRDGQCGEHPRSSRLPVVIGNPPWVRLHRLTTQQRAEFRRDFDVARAAAWEPGASAAGAGSGFAAQVDVAALFVERSVRLLAPRGALSLLVPVKLWRSLAGGGLRRFLASETQLQRLEDFSEASRTFDAAVYPSVVVATRCMPAPPTSPHVHIALHDRGNHVLAWRASLDDLAFDDSPGAPWILLPPEARAAFDRLRRAGRPLAESPIGRPLLGVKSGCNDAFIGKLLGANDVIAEMRVHGGHRVTVERALLRPLLRGEHLRRWQTTAGQDVIIWTHDETGGALAELPQHAAKWFARWRRDLVARTDARNTIRWWSLFRTESARCDHPRVVWADVGREPRACVLRAGDPAVALNSCYVVRCADEIDAYAIAALLNGPLARSWLNAAAEPARGGYRRYLGWTMSLLPVPSDWRRARKYLAPLATRAEAPSERELLEASLAAYRLDASDVEPLIAWAIE